MPISDTHSRLTTQREMLIKIGAKVVRHGRYVIFQMADIAVPKELFPEKKRLTWTATKPGPSVGLSGASSRRMEGVRMTRKMAKPASRNRAGGSAGRKCLDAVRSASAYPGRVLSFTPFPGESGGPRIRVFRLQLGGIQHDKGREVPPSPAVCGRTYFRGIAVAGGGEKGVAQGRVRDEHLHKGLFRSYGGVLYLHL